MSLSLRAPLLLAEDGVPLLRLGDAMFRLADGGLIRFSAALPWQPEDSPASQFLEPEAPTEPQPVPPVSVAAPEEPTTSPVAAASTEPPATPPIVEAMAPLEPEPAPAVTAAADAMPPQQSQEELDLFAQFANLYADFDGDQALANLLQSDWAAANNWQQAGGAPLG